MQNLTGDPLNEELETILSLDGAEVVVSLIPQRGMRVQTALEGSKNPTLNGGLHGIGAERDAAWYQQQQLAFKGKQDALQAQYKKEQDARQARYQREKDEREATYRRKRDEREFALKQKQDEHDREMLLEPQRGVRVQTAFEPGIAVQTAFENGKNLTLNGGFYGIGASRAAAVYQQQRREIALRREEIAYKRQQAEIELEKLKLQNRQELQNMSGGLIKSEFSQKPQPGFLCDPDALPYGQPSTEDTPVPYRQDYAPKPVAAPLRTQSEPQEPTFPEHELA